MCPYYLGDLTEKCNLTDTCPLDYTRDNNCKSSSNWVNCPNYTNPSPAYDEAKITKRLR